MFIHHFLGYTHCILVSSHAVAMPNYLDLGGALAAFGLIFAAYQLRKPGWEVALRLRDGWQRNLVWILGGCGLLFTLIGVLVAQIPPCSFVSFGSPLLYQIIAYLFFIASPLSLIYFISNTKGLFTRENSRKFYGAMVREVAQSNDERLNAVLEVLVDNFEDICKAAADEANPGMNKSARAILDVILSDEAMVKLLTTKRVDALQHIFIQVEKYHVNRRDSGVGIPRIARNLFSDRESFFYRHLDRAGLALSSNIYKTIFESPILLTNFDLFGWPTLDYTMKNAMDSGGIKVLIEALSKSIETYLKTGNVPTRHINNGLSYLSDIFGSICLNLGIEERRGADINYSFKDELWSLHEIANFLGHDYIFLGHDETLNQNVIEKEKTVPEADFFSDDTINAGVAAAIFKAFEQLTYIEKTTNIYHTVIELLHGMIYEENAREGYRAAFEKRIWEQIGHNVVDRYYPAALKTYLILIGLQLTSTDRRAGWIGEQTERMRRLLYVDLTPLLDANEKMVDGTPMKEALLPDLMDYVDGEFYYTVGLGRGTKTKIAPPPSGAQSALEDVDLNNRNSLL